MSAFCDARLEQRASRSFLRGLLGGIQNLSVVVLVVLFSVFIFSALLDWRGCVSVIGDFFPVFQTFLLNEMIRSSLACLIKKPLYNSV
jgi:hypothetical protein